MIDPKILELSIYEGIPHLIADVVTNPKRASAALHGIVLQDGRALSLDGALGVRNIISSTSASTSCIADGQTTLRLKPRPGQDRGRRDSDRSASPTSSS